jgi:hypothetical protein
VARADDDPSAGTWHHMLSPTNARDSTISLVNKGRFIAWPPESGGDKGVGVENPDRSSVLSNRSDSTYIIYEISSNGVRKLTIPNILGARSGDIPLMPALALPQRRD